MRWILFYPHFFSEIWLGERKKWVNGLTILAPVKNHKWSLNVVPFLAESGFQDAISWFVNQEYYFSNKGHADAEKIKYQKIKLEWMKLYISLISNRKACPP